MNEVHEKANAGVIYLYGAFTRKDYYENLEGILTELFGDVKFSILTRGSRPGELRVDYSNVVEGAAGASFVARELDAWVSRGSSRSFRPIGVPASWSVRQSDRSWRYGPSSARMARSSFSRFTLLSSCPRTTSRSASSRTFSTTSRWAFRRSASETSCATALRRVRRSATRFSASVPGSEHSTVTCC